MHRAYTTMLRLTVAVLTPTTTHACANRPSWILVGAFSAEKTLAPPATPPEKPPLKATLPLGHRASARCETSPGLIETSFDLTISRPSGSAVTSLPLAWCWP
jgi:hypothetical protein